MRYIENLELREWVKESLRKTIFQKAHALAVQTGCEVLVKLKDSTSVHDCPLYYATEALQKDYQGDGVREDVGDMFVAGETGLPCFPMVDTATQSSGGETNGEQSQKAAHANVGTLLTETVDQGVGESAVPMQLSVADDATTESTLNPKLENVPTDDGFATQDSLSEVVVKLERLDEEELNQRLGGGDPIGEQASFGQFDNNSLSFDGGGAGADLGARSYQMMSPKPYQCGVCQKAFRSVQVLQKHTQTFHMRPQHAGGRSRGRGRGLYHNRPAAHRQQHASQARFLCVMCNRSFRSPDLLQDHMTRSHMGHATPVQLSTSQGTFDPSSAQTSDAPATATLQSLQAQQQSPIVVSSYQSLPTDDNQQFQIPQAPQNPDAFNISDASTSSSTFASPSASSSPRTPMFRYQTSGQARASTSSAGTSQATPSPSRVANKHDQFGREKVVTLRSIMSAILLIKGPVCSKTCISQYGPMPIRRIKPSQFLDAVNLLEAANLGTLVKLHRNDIFVKKAPSEIQNAFNVNPDLCDIDRYTARFNMPSPTCVNQSLRDELIQGGFVKAEHFINPQDYNNSGFNKYWNHYN